MEEPKIIQLEAHQRVTYKTKSVEIKEGSENMAEDKVVTKQELQQLEEKIDLKIKIAVQPLEGKIDNLSDKIENLPSQFENIIYKEREYQNNKTKETQRYIWGTIGIGIVSIIVSVTLHFI